MAKVATKKIQQLDSFKKADVFDAMNGLNMEGISSQMAKLQVEFQKTLADLSTKMLSRVTEFNTINQAIVFKEAELKRLHAIESEAITLEELQAHRTELEQANRKYNEELLQARRREEDVYNYNLSIQRRREFEAFTQQLAESTRQLAEREQAVVARENKVLLEETRIAKFPAELEAAVKKAIAETTDALVSKHNTTLTLVKKDAEADIRVLKQEVVSRDQKIADLQAQVKDLHHQVNTANQNATSVAAKALESTSDRSTVQALQKVIETGAGTKSQK